MVRVARVKIGLCVDYGLQLPCGLFLRRSEIFKTLDLRIEFKKARALKKLFKERQICIS